MSRPGFRLAIIGQTGITNVGGSLERAAQAMGIEHRFFDMAEASQAPRWLRALSWRLRDRRPPRMRHFAGTVVSTLRREPVDLVVATGMPPLHREALEALRSTGARLANFSTDDPWNPGQRARWFLDALPAYDVVFSPRTANLDDFRSAGCRAVHPLAFGYDEGLLAERAPTSLPARRWSVLFVGGGDEDRRDFFADFRTRVPETLLVGSYWDRWRETRDLAIGGRAPEEVVWLTRRAPVCLILVRRANRDGHVMRSFEAAAAGGCLVVEDTADHRAIFGADGESVRYFGSASDAARVCRELVDDVDERQRLAASVRRRIEAGRHTYRDRLREMIRVSTGIGDIGSG
jgi:hypothetical protein